MAIRGPDPQRGIYDTMYLGGDASVPVAFSAHLMRLATSAQDLYKLSLPRHLAERISEQAVSAGATSRLRVDLVPDAHTRALSESITVRAMLPVPVTTVDLVTVSVPAWQGRHKLIDGPRYLQELQPDMDTKDMLLVDPMALETGTGNIFAVMNDRLIAAPADRTLPGITRAAVIKTARQLGIATITDALIPESLINDSSEVFVSSSIARLRSVATIDGRTIGDGRTPMRTTIQAALDANNLWDISLADYSSESSLPIPSRSH